MTTTAAELKSHLTETLRELRAGKIDREHANSIAMQSREIVRVVRTEIAIRQSAIDLGSELELFASTTPVSDR